MRLSDIKQARRSSIDLIIAVRASRPRCWTDSGCPFTKERRALFKRVRLKWIEARCSRRSRGGRTCLSPPVVLGSLYDGKIAKRVCVNAGRNDIPSLAIHERPRLHVARFRRNRSASYIATTCSPQPYAQGASLCTSQSGGQRQPVSIKSHARPRPGIRPNSCTLALPPAVPSTEGGATPVQPFPHACRSPDALTPCARPCRHDPTRYSSERRWPSGSIRESGEDLSLKRNAGRALCCAAVLHLVGSNAVVEQF